MIGMTGLNGFDDRFGSPMNRGGAPTIFALGNFVLGKLLGAGSGLTPRLVGKPGIGNRRKIDEKLKRPGWAGRFGVTTTVFMSIGLN